MKSLLTLFIIIIFLCPSSARAQKELHRWRPLTINGTQKLWYDVSSFNTVKDSKMEVWILEMHNPPLKFEQIPGKIVKSKTLYAVDLRTAKYGILKVVYYNSSNKELFRYNYENPSYTDDIKYTYPILENSFMHRVIEKYYKQSGGGKKG